MGLGSACSVAKLQATNVAKCKRLADQETGHFCQQSAVNDAGIMETHPSAGAGASSSATSRASQLQSRRPVGQNMHTSVTTIRAYASSNESHTAQKKVSPQALLSLNVLRMVLADSQRQLTKAGLPNAPCIGQFLAPQVLRHSPPLQARAPDKRVLSAPWLKKRLRLGRQLFTKCYVDVSKVCERAR